MHTVTKRVNKRRPSATISSCTSQPSDDEVSLNQEPTTSGPSPGPSGTSPGPSGPSPGPSGPSPGPSGTKRRRKSSTPGAVMNDNMDDRYHNLSLRLYEVIDWICVSEELRRKYVEQCLVYEILQTADAQQCDMNTKETVYIFGSSAEGTTTDGLDPDLDVLFCNNNNVVEKISHGPRFGGSYLMVNDGSVKPGYVKLQAVWNQIGQTTRLPELDKYVETDHLGRICLKHLEIDVPYHLERNGPAILLRKKGTVKNDMVFAFRCRLIPSFAQSWITRRRAYNWPSQSQLEQMQGYGCFLVGVNHPSSQNGPIEWRLSFSLQERLLMHSLNSTQHKCYVLLKIIKKDIIQKQVGESITSYHCKTCIIYAIEQTPCDFWTPGNMLRCTHFCIKLLLQWVTKNNCPNYFIPDENMFDRIEHRTLRRVEDVLETMIGDWCEFLWSLKCGDIGKFLHEVVHNSGSKLMKAKSDGAIGDIVSTYHTNMLNLLFFRKSVLSQHMQSSKTEILIKLSGCIDRMHQTERSTDHTPEHTRMVFSYFYPHLHLQAAQCVASDMLATSDEGPVAWMLDTFKYHMEKSKDCDVVSAYLIKASYWLQCKRYSVCEELLTECENDLKPHVSSACGCFVRTEACREYKKQPRSNTDPVSYPYYARTCLAACLIFLPSQVYLVPLALHYEMFRSVFTPPGSRDERHDHWFDWIAVDSKVYLFFLQYVLYSKTNQPDEKQIAIDNLFRIIHTDRNLGHNETAYNLLGWIYRQEGRTHQAMECFLQSWKIRPNHNAAKWHLAVLIYENTKMETHSKRVQDGNVTIVYNRKVSRIGSAN